MDNNETLSETEIDLSEYMITVFTFLWFISVIFCIFNKYWNCFMRCKEQYKMYIERKKLNKYIIHENINDICPICIENFEKETIVRLDCNHVYHKDCLEMWIINNNNDECPYCRKIIEL